MNFLALLGWSYDDKTTIMSPDELIERFSLDRVVPSPATFDYEKLDWLNGMHLRALSPDEYADELVKLPARRGLRLGRNARPSSRADRAGEDRALRTVSRLRRLPVPRDRSPVGRCSTGGAPVVTAAHEELDVSSRSLPPEIEAALRGLAERLELSPRKAFEPIRIAVTGSKVSPGLFESLELLGKEETLSASQCCCRPRSGLGFAKGSRAR